jgi:hypothetical protein
MRSKVTPGESDKDVDGMLHQLELLNTQFEFYFSETGKLDQQALKISQHEDITSSDAIKLDKLIDKIEELFVRYQKDVKIYNALLARIGKHFTGKYNIDLGL